jgi:anti-sigma regulatory factor (Ser/Thr protein kinase)
VRDNGPGIENIELAMKEGYSTATEEAREMGFGAGMGLPNIKKNSDGLKIDSEKGKGTLLAISFDLKAGG